MEQLSNITSGDSERSDDKGVSPILSGAVGAIVGYFLRDKLASDTCPDSQPSSDGGNQNDGGGDQPDPEIVYLPSALLGAPENILGIYDFGINLEDRPFSAVQLISALVPIVSAQQYVLERHSTEGFNMSVQAQQLRAVLASDIIGATPGLACEGKKFDSSGVYLDLSTESVIETIQAAREVNNVPEAVNILFMRFGSDTSRALGHLLQSVNLSELSDLLTSSDQPSILNALNRVPLPMTSDIFGPAAQLVSSITAMTTLSWYENRFVPSFSYHRTIKPGYTWDDVLTVISDYLTLFTPGNMYNNATLYDGDPVIQQEGSGPSSSSF